MPNQIPETDLLAPFLQTEAPAPEEPEAAEPDYVCECCSDGMSVDEAHTVAVGERGYTISAGFYATLVETEIWCDSCFRDSTVYINDYMDYRHLRECGSRGYVSEGYASDNFYCHDSGEWYCEPEPEPDYDDDEDSGSERMLLSYSTDVIDVLGWPRESRASDLLFGVELEMEGKGGTTADDIVKILGGAKGTRTGRAILKSAEA